MMNPATASWGLRISDSDFAKLKRGLLAQDMDDKWAFLAMTEEELSEEQVEDERRKGKPAHEKMPEEELTEGQLLDREAWELGEIESYELEREQNAAAREAALKLDEGGNISIRRAWSNTEHYRLVVKPSSGAGSDGAAAAGTAEIKAITWDQNLHGEHISEEQAKVDAVLMCRSQLECEIRRRSRL